MEVWFPLNSQQIGLDIELQMAFRLRAERKCNRFHYRYFKVLFKHDVKHFFYRFINIIQAPPIQKVQSDEF